MNYFYIAFAGTLFLGAFVLINHIIGQSAASRRIREVTLSSQFIAKRQSGKQRVQSTMVNTIAKFRARFGLSENEQLRKRFAHAGIRGTGPMEVYFAARILGPVMAIIGGSFIHSNTFMWIIGFSVAAYLAPDFWLDRLVKARRERIRRSVPDAIDLLVICVDAGLGLDQAMLRVGVELCVSHPEINEEFLQINREQRAGKLRMEAWKSMAERTKLVEIDAFTSMLVQTEKFGTPIARALSTYADSMRQKRRQRAEEMAAKTTVKMIFPLVLFIFPSMFIVLLAPAILSIGRGLSNLGGQ